MKEIKVMWKEHPNRKTCRESMFEVPDETARLLTSYDGNDKEYDAAGDAEYWLLGELEKLCKPFVLGETYDWFIIDVKEA